jgi:hypothetical protein
MRTIFTNVILALYGFALTTALQADDFFHKPQHDFLFGNHIDTHQETRLKLDKITGAPISLFGKFYIFYTGDTDPVSDLPIARHPRGLASDGSFDERCGTNIKCVVGWEIRGVPGAARFVSHSGVNGEDYPIWLVNRAEEVTAPASGMVIPQDGYYSHFQWITTTSTDPRASVVSAACDKQSAAELESQDPSAVNQVCQGWFLQITARKKFAFQHGDEIIPIHNGADIRSHLNIITNYKPWPDDTIINTRPGEGH